MKNSLATVHRILTAIISIAVFVQMFLAGIWHAGVAATPDLHVFLGLGMLLFALIALVCALIARLPRNIIVSTAVLFVLILLQPVLIEQRRLENGIALLSAFHTLNAAFIGVVSGVVAQASGAKAAGRGMTEPAVQMGD